MEAVNDYSKQSVGVLSKHGRSLKGIRRVEVFDKSISDAMTVNRRLPLMGGVRPGGRGTGVRVLGPRFQPAAGENCF